MSHDRTELEHAIDALRHDVEPPLDGGAATEAAILRAVRTPPPWWKSPWAIGGGVGTITLAVGLGLLAWSQPTDAPTHTVDDSADVVNAPPANDAADTNDAADANDAADTNDADANDADANEAVSFLRDPVASPATPARSSSRRTTAQPVNRSATPMSDAPTIATVRATPMPGRPDPTAPPTDPATTDPSNVPSATPGASPRTTQFAADPPSFDEQRVRFREAHRLQYTAPPQTTLDAWDRFLRDVSTGPFADEAHYYRALSLGRLGRTHEARVALEGIAAGRHGERHRADATRVLQQLAR